MQNMTKVQNTISKSNHTIFEHVYCPNFPYAASKKNWDYGKNMIEAKI